MEHLPAKKWICFVFIITCFTVWSQQRIPHKIIRAVHENHQGFSGVIALLGEDGTPISKLTFGHADPLRTMENTDTTSFRLASLSKIYTAMAILKLAEDKRISLDDTIGKFFNGFTDKRADGITILELLGHTSGWGHYWENEVYLNNFNTIESHIDFMDIIKRISLDTDPGISYQYSNIGYIVLGAIVEEVTQSAYEDFVAKNFFEPLQMKQSSFSHTRQELAYAIAQTDQKDTPKNSGTGRADGGAFSSLNDLIKLSKSLFYERNVLSPISMNLLMNDFVDTEENYFELQGGFPGVSTLLVHEGNSGLTLIILANQDPPIAQSMAETIISVLYDEANNDSNQIFGHVLDANNNSAIPFVNIGIPLKGVGTATSETGEFSLIVPDGYKTDSIVFSALGYQKKKMAIQRLIGENGNGAIYLEPQTEVMDEVIVYSNKLKRKVLGSKMVSPLASGAYIGGGKPGATLVRFFEITDSPCFLYSVKVHVRSNRNKKLFKLRLRIFSEKDSMPHENLLKKNYIVESTVKAGWLSFDLESPLKLTGSSFIGVEWIEKVNNRTNARNAYPRISYVNSPKSNSYARKTSLDKWDGMEINPIINITVKK